MKLKFYSATLPSTTHPKENQDAFFTDEKNKTAGVFDGVGGLSYGTKAANTVSDCFKKQLAKGSLETAFEVCHEILKNKSRSEFGKDMGTTGTVAQIYLKQQTVLVAWGSVGDSRIYHLSDNRLKQESTDDSLITQAQERGWLNHEKAERINQATDLKGLNEVEKNLFNGRNIITQALGIGDMKPTIGKFNAKKGDQIILTSDGIHDNLTNEQTEEILKQEPLDPAKKLVEEATIVSESNSLRAKQDDMSAVVVELI